MRAAVKARLLETLPARLGIDATDVERVLDIELARLVPREEIERLMGGSLSGRE
jgi:hypothetical protein